MQYNESKMYAAREINEWNIKKTKIAWEEKQKQLLLKYGLSKKVTENIKKELTE